MTSWWAWFTLGALTMSLGWLIVVACLLDRLALARRRERALIGEIRWRTDAICEGDAVVRELFHTIDRQARTFVLHGAMDGEATDMTVTLRRRDS